MKELKTWKEVIQALLDGEKVEYFHDSAEKWIELTHFPDISFSGLSYAPTQIHRIKPTDETYVAALQSHHEIQFQVWRSTDSCMEFWSWDEVDQYDYDQAKPENRRIIQIVKEG